MSDHEATDPVEGRLGATLHRLAEEAPAALPGDGSHVVERLVHQRAVRRRRTMGVGMAAAVVALVGGVLALRPDPATNLSFADQPAGSAAAGNVTGYSTGSMTGSPKGWTHRYELAPDAVDLPRLVADLGPEWEALRVSASTSDQGSGTAAAPLTILAGGDQVVVASVQPVSKLGPGEGEQVDVRGRRGTLTQRSGGTIQLIVDLGDDRRALVSSIGVDQSALFDLIASLHERDGAWVVDVPEGSALAPVDSVPTTSLRSRSIAWTRPVERGAAPTTTAAGMLAAFDDGEQLSLTVSTGGAYEFYGLVAQRAGWSRVVTPAESPTTLLGVELVASISMVDGGGGAVTFGLDAQGLVYTVDRFAYYDENGQALALAPTSVQLVPADDATWTALVTTALQNSAARNAEANEARARKEDDAAAAGVPVTVEAVPPTTAPPVVAPPTTVP